LTDAAKHRFDLLLFWSLDRLTREGTYKTLTYLRRLTDAEVKFKSYTEQYIDSLGVFGEAIIGVLAAVAAQERIRISSGRKRDWLERVRKGRDLVVLSRPWMSGRHGNYERPALASGRSLGNCA
jgi:DNA invertase Pin-like site-specific DNA recombinase